MNTDVMFSAQSEDWGTPKSLFEYWNELYGPFTCDPATTPENPLGTPVFYTKQNNGLEKPWLGKIYCNPPYGRGIKDWVKKACEEVACGHAERVVMLLPARTDTAWFHDLIYRCPYQGVDARVKFLRGRVIFEGAKNSAPFPSMLVIFEPV